jgi:hypothetical protein
LAARRARDVPMTAGRCTQNILIGVPWLMIGEEASGAPNDARAQAAD